VSSSQTIVPPPCHAISFFQDDTQLCAEIAGFVADGLDCDEPALVVTNEAHRLGIGRELGARGVDVAATVAAGDLLLVDAEGTLASLMAGGSIDGQRYHEGLGNVVSRLLRGRPGPIRIFGDMVDLLWQREDYEAAIRIELLSNELAARHPISVICGYSMGHFLKTARRLEVVTALHGRVHPVKLRKPA